MRVKSTSSTLGRCRAAMRVLCRGLKVRESSEVGRLCSRVLKVGVGSVRTAVSSVCRRVRRRSPGNIFFYRCAMFQRVCELRTEQILQSNGTRCVLLLAVGVGRERLRRSPIEVRCCEGESNAGLRGLLAERLQVKSMTTECDSRRCVIVLPCYSCRSSRGIVGEVLSGFGGSVSDSGMALGTRAERMSIGCRLPRRDEKKIV